MDERTRSILAVMDFYIKDDLQGFFNNCNSLMDGYEQINDQLSDERGFLNYLLEEITDRNDEQYTKDVLQLLATINLNAFKED